MAQNDRNSRSRSLRLESLETRNLLTLIGAPPTLTVLNGPGVHHNHAGDVYITQPTTLQIKGTAQPGAPGTQTQVSIFAEDSQGNPVNNGQPLAVVTPDYLGRYSALVQLPSFLPKDVNYLVARQESHAVQVSQLAINGTTLTGLTGALTVDATTLTNLAGTGTNSATTLSGLNATIANPGFSITGLGGTLTVPATPISGITGTITTPVFPISTPGGPGTAGPAVSTLTGGSGTLGAQVGTLAGGTGTVAPSTSTLTQTGTAAIAGTTSTWTQTGAANIAATTGAFTQTGAANIAATTGTATTQLNEVAVSNPVTVVIHVPHGVFGHFPLPVFPGGGGPVLARAHHHRGK